MGAHNGVATEDRYRDGEVGVSDDAGGLFIIRAFSRDVDARLAEAVLDGGTLADQ